MPPSANFIAFDLDGVILRSVEMLRGVYLAFLRAYGRKGSDSEFDRLNGPGISEIVALLKLAHDLREPEPDLLAHYLALVEAGYRDARPSPGAVLLLNDLKAADIPLALASSAPRMAVDSALERLGVAGLFDSVVTGSDVTRAKPSPDIYLRVVARFPGLSGVAVEDSANGAQAASAAGLRVVGFGPNFPPSRPVWAHAADMGSLRALLLGAGSRGAESL